MCLQANTFYELPANLCKTFFLFNFSHNPLINDYSNIFHFKISFCYTCCIALKKSQTIYLQISLNMQHLSMEAVKLWRRGTETFSHCTGTMQTERQWVNELRFHYYWTLLTVWVLKSKTNQERQELIQNTGMWGKNHDYTNRQNLSVFDVFLAAVCV